MSFQRYPRYKPSGVEWLGDVPEHWSIVQLKRDLQFLTSGSRGWAGNYSESGSLFIRIGNLTRNSIRLDLSDVQRVEVPDGVEGRRTEVRPGDVLFSITAYLGSVAIVPENLEPAFVSQHVALARVRGRLFLPQWVAYFALSSAGKAHLEAKGYGGTKIQLSLEDVAELLLTSPPVQEQLAIASSLDRETAKIDALVEEQMRLIELLREKRQAIITHAVTKGFNPNAPMKSSGIEWVGDVPAHWEVKRIKYFTRSIEQGWSPQCEEYPVVSAKEWGVLKVGCVNGGVFNPAENKALPSDLVALPELGIAADDLLISRANTRELVGSAASAARDYPNLMLCDKLYRLRLDQSACQASFLSYYFSIGAVRSQIEIAATGASNSMLNIGQATILELHVPLPEVSEQTAIVELVEAEATRINRLLSDAVALIALLQERRTALISAAVTGKIDVRTKVQVPDARLDGCSNWDLARNAAERLKVSA